RHPQRRHPLAVVPALRPGSPADPAVADGAVVVAAAPAGVRRRPRRGDQPLTPSAVTRAPSGTLAGSARSGRAATPTPGTPPPNGQSPSTGSAGADRSAGAPAGNLASKAPIVL